MMRDDSIFQFGKMHKGKKLANVPDDYLIWFWGENCVAYRAGEIKGQKREIMEYIEDCFDNLP